MITSQTEPQPFSNNNNYNRLQYNQYMPKRNEEIRHSKVAHMYTMTAHFEKNILCVEVYDILLKEIELEMNFHKEISQCLMLLIRQHQISIRYQLMSLSQFQFQNLMGGVTGQLMARLCCGYYYIFCLLHVGIDLYNTVTTRIGYLLMQS